MVNGDDGPIVGQGPLIFRNGRNRAGAIEFHLARANRISALLMPARRSLYRCRVPAQRSLRVGSPPVSRGLSQIAA
jgi:hypothetical protein